MIAVTSSSTSDAQLMRRVAEGDRVAFETIHERYRAPAFALALRLMRHSAAAEEVTQEAFLGLWRSAARYEPSRATLRTWLLALVHNRSIDSIRRSRRHRLNVPIEDAGAEHLPAPGSTEEEVADRDQSRHLRQLLSTIPGKQREVVELAYFDELTHVEIASGLDIPLSTVKGRMRLALTRLHQTLTSECPVAAG